MLQCAMNTGRKDRIESDAETTMLMITRRDMLRAELAGTRIIYEKQYDLNPIGVLAVAVAHDEDRYSIALLTNIPGPLLLHWGIARRSRDEWEAPPPALCPAGTTLLEHAAGQTPFADQEGYRRLRVTMTDAEAPLGISFVLYQVNRHLWINNRGNNFYVPVTAATRAGAPFTSEELTELADVIISKEMSRDSWTLMHRYNLCYDLMDRAGTQVEALALLFVWLRFSALRQLDWQRKYNTKPRELAHSLGRLTTKLASAYDHGTEQGELIRLMMSTLGHGSDGQQVRDEILTIMHRHHIKEISGHFLEQWHQKLHNNTTPDDVVICEAYLNFLRSDGNLDPFYQRLAHGGVTRERLHSYERPITSTPDFIPHLKDALIQDFSRFLHILKSVHAGTDLGVALETAQRLLTPDLRRLMDSVWRHRDDTSISPVRQAETIVAARERLEGLLLSTNEPGQTRDLLFLDLALEAFLRIVVERRLHTELSPDDLADLVDLSLQNLLLTRHHQELDYCRRHWLRLLSLPRFTRDWSLHATAVVDRLQRLAAGIMDRYIALLQPKAEFLGSAFRAEPWTVDLFGEEVTRGQPVFILSALLRKINPIMRQAAQVGAWDILSRQEAWGELTPAASLKPIQDKIFSQPTVILTDTLGGDEEIPQGVTAVLTTDDADMVSHIAIRARNRGILLAVCYDADTIDRVRLMSGKPVHLAVSAAGDIVIETDSADTTVSAAPERPARESPLPPPVFYRYAIPMAEFRPELVGGKSMNCARLCSLLPEWINIPRSVALPFGVFEKVLEDDRNKSLASLYKGLCVQVQEDSHPAPQKLAELRSMIPELIPPSDLIPELEKVMEKAGLPQPASWEDAWQCIKQVWASKWNERATVSRMIQGIAHQDLVMAVLIQEAVPADYAFVIHTVHPSTGNQHELFAEMVCGLGETLVGNHPGRALSFTSAKKELRTELRSFPSKSAGLFGGGLMFRSDSNGEDLPGYAGAGLYDSFLLPPPVPRILDYSQEPLLWNEAFQQDLLATITRIGLLIESAFGAPQDIEGAVRGDQYYVVQTRPQVGVDHG